jgi:hypothetical protein
MVIDRWLSAIFINGASASTADVTKVTPLVAVRDGRGGPGGDRGGLQSALGGEVREVGRDDDARMPEAARRPLQRFCALAALTTAKRPGAVWRVLAGRAG